MSVEAFDQLISQPGLRRLLSLPWDLFGVNPALISVDGSRVFQFDREERAQPFCRALDKVPGGRALCAMCDKTKFLEARRDGQTLRYRCHAGLLEFIIPVIRDGQTIALLQCGQVHGRVPTADDWMDEARVSLQGAGISVAGLRSLFQRNRVLTEERQTQLLDIIELIAVRLAQADLRSAVPGRTQAALGRAMTYVETHLGDPLPVDAIAHAAGVSTRSLMRLFRNEVQCSVTDFVQRRRIARARRLLKQGGMTCAEIAFDCGFGSVQHFNRIFRRMEGASPTAWLAARR